MNRNITRIVAVAASLAMGFSLAACGSNSADSDKGHVYFMNNKAEVVDQYKELASMYTKKTGMKVDVQTGAAGTYDATMTSTPSTATPTRCRTRPNGTASSTTRRSSRTTPQRITR